MEIDEQDRGKSIKVLVGDTITVCLPENPTTGYRWKLEAAQGLQPTGDAFAAGGGVGASGTRQLQLRADAPGNYQLQLKHLREWEGDKSINDRFQVSIEVVCPGT
jgi:inhibitor of cysteine peptidase